jgi:dihydroorotase
MLQKQTNMYTLIKNASVVNEGKITRTDVSIFQDRIEKIQPEISIDSAKKVTVIEAEGLFLIPGMIDDQVHFREPGLTHKATILTESKAAVAGGITSFMDMPNTIPNTLTLDLLEDKYQIASQSSLANYSFFMGVSQDNLEEALKIDTSKVCGITDDGLYFNNDEGILANYPVFLEKLFSRTNALIALHSEDDEVIKNNTRHFIEQYGHDIPAFCHPLIRSKEACIKATTRVIDLAKKHNSRLHLFHISTLSEALLFDSQTPLEKKRITAEACVHHLFFNDTDYNRLGHKIKWNPAIKTENDRSGLVQALLSNHLDIIATDHAPHTWSEKEGNYFQSKSGAPLVQHALPALMELYHDAQISIEKLVEKTSHNVAKIYNIKDRGFIREGYYADLVLIDPNNTWRASKTNTLYKCGWSPFEDYQFKSKILKTFVNGKLVYNDGHFDSLEIGKRLLFDRSN